MQVSQNSSFAVPGLALPSHVHSEPTERVHLVQLPRDAARHGIEVQVSISTSAGSQTHGMDFPNFDTGPCYGVDGGRARQGTNAMCTP
ncbi:hypothetical protein CCM_06244 [Cordyceps militaris CM01]|uniref:Uncharacterized protein n=1 Tax=Cordyceps militaris (strain CM01) TaxID=983644 RepID=G3JJJ6_CORMM|nr:uncharacterized protein CCM_06244 [Cordyceps militaris CM01]EGX92084.1 hypothetical protein CCM_06244 [Cordyceps militaris CM01]